MQTILPSFQLDFSSKGIFWGLCLKLFMAKFYGHRFSVIFVTSEYSLE